MIEATMLRILGVLLVLLAALGAIYTHLFVWRVRSPGQSWPWRLCASFGGPALSGLGLIAGSWILVGAGAATWLLARLVRDGSLEHPSR
jgi:hypothetical protein